MSSILEKKSLLEMLHGNTEAKFSSPEEEIKYLREEIQKRNEITKNFGDRIDVKEHANDVIREHISKTPESILPKNIQIKDVKKQILLKSLSVKPTDEKVEKIISIMADNGVHSAFEVVFDLKDKELEDDFHRFLVQYLLEDTQEAKKIKKDLSKTEWKALNLKLFEIIMPETKEKGEGKGDVKSFIHFMEQFYTSMLAICSDLDNKEQDYYAIEMAKPNNSNDVSFYVAVPNQSSDLLEKSLFALFPNIKIKTSEEDYNLFSSQGFQVGAFAKTLKSPALSIRTYDKLEGESISLLISSFTKLKREGESAAFQIIIKPVGNRFIKKYTNMLQDMKKGETLKKVLEKDNFFSDFINTFKDINKTKEDIEKAKSKNQEKIEEQKNQEYVGEKIKSTILDTNIRLVVNAESLERARSILNDLSSTFRQYSEADGNGLDFKSLKDKELNSLLNNFIFRSYKEDESLPINLKELATLYHLPSYVKDFNQLKKVESTSAPARLDMPEEGLFLGTNYFRGNEKKVYLQAEMRLRHTYIIGQTGSGKSVMLINMILQDIANGEGCCFVDPHGEDLVTKIIPNIPKERWKDVIYFDPTDNERPMGLNMLEYDQSKPIQKDLIVAELLSIFQKLFGGANSDSMGPAFVQYFSNCTRLVMEHPESGCTLIDISRVLSDSDYREYKLSKSKNPLINQFFKNALATSGDQGFENYVQYISSKFDSFVSNLTMRNIIGQEKSSFNISDIMDNKKIFLVNLSKGKLGDQNAFLIGLIIVGKFTMAALARDNLAQKPPFYLYLDEFQNVASPSIASILSEARKYKLSLTMAHQYIKQLDENIKGAVFGNVGNKLIFRISEEDAKFVEGGFAPTFTWADIIKQENLTCYCSILVNGFPERPFNIKEAFPPKGSQEAFIEIQKLSRENFGRDKDEVNEEIMKKFNFE